MIRREHFCNKLNELGYRYKRETLRVFLYKKPNNPDYVSVPRRELMDESYVRNQLRQCGCTLNDVETFIGAYRLQ